MDGASRFVLLSQDCFGYSGSFVVPQKFFVFLYTTNELSEKEIKIIISFIIASKKITISKYKFKQGSETLIH